MPNQFHDLAFLEQTFQERDWADLTTAMDMAAPIYFASGLGLVTPDGPVASFLMLYTRVDVNGLAGAATVGGYMEIPLADPTANILLDYPNKEPISDKEIRFISIHHILDEINAFMAADQINSQYAHLHEE